MRILYDPRKREKTLAERGLDLRVYPAWRGSPHLQHEKGKRS